MQSESGTPRRRHRLGAEAGKVPRPGGVMTATVATATTQPALVRARNGIDALLGRVTMYRLVVICLGLHTALAFVLSFAGVLYYEPVDLAATLAVLLAVTYGSNRLYGAMFGVHPHGESSLITAGLLFFLLWPSTEPLELLAIALAAAAASASKYLVAYRGRHIVNPAAFGVLFVTLLQLSGGVWWVATGPMLPAVVVLALVVAYRTRKLPVVALFVAAATALMVGFRLFDGDTVGAAIEYALVTTPVVFFAGFMLTEPLTLPPTRRQQLAVAAGVAVLFALPTLVSVDLGVVALTPELALIVGNVVAFLLGQRRGIGLTLTGRRSLGPTTGEFTFTPDAPVRFAPGQYLELTLPHGKADSRGTRRVFSIATADPTGETVSVGVKIPARGASSFKRELADLPVGTHLRATTVGGDFVLPADLAQPLLLVAGGIGITPFLSQLASCVRDGRDVVLVYGVTDPAEIPYRDELAAFGIPVVLAVPGTPTGLPAAWQPVVVPVRRRAPRRGAGRAQPGRLRLGTAGHGQRPVRRTAGAGCAQGADRRLHRLLSPNSGRSLCAGKIRSRQATRCSPRDGYGRPVPKNPKLIMARCREHTDENCDTPMPRRQRTMINNRRPGRARINRDLRRGQPRSTVVARLPGAAITE